jgi:DNA-binding NarL/FixJ family response regulator
MREAYRRARSVAAVAVLADDPVTRDGAVARLSAYREIEVVGADQWQRGQVLLVLAEKVTDDILGQLEHFYREAGAGDRSVVLVAAEVRRSQVLRAIGAGLVCLLPRHETGYDRIVRAVVAARDGRAELPAAMQRLLVDQIRSIQRDLLAPLDLTISGLTVREAEVLKLLSDGLDIKEVAAKANYSERTVKTIIHDLLFRLNLRNRTHAVAFALRSGAI